MAIYIKSICQPLVSFCKGRNFDAFWFSWRNFWSGYARKLIKASKDSYYNLVSTESFSETIVSLVTCYFEGQISNLCCIQLSVTKQGYVNAINTTMSPPSRPPAKRTWEGNAAGGRSEQFQQLHHSRAKTFDCSHCGRTSLSRIGLVSHQRACNRRGQPTLFNLR